MLKNFCILFMIIGLSFACFEARAQAFNPYQHAYQGWNGEGIKKGSGFRRFLNKFSANVSVGYGHTFYSHVVPADVLETPDKLIMLGTYTVNGNQVDYTGVTDWLNAPAPVSGTMSIATGSDNRILYTDSAENKYKGSGFSIPVDASLQFDIDRFRIGGGISYEFHKVNQLKPKNQGQWPYKTNFTLATMFRYYFYIGAKVYHLKGWDYNVDIRIGKVKYGGQYDKSVLQNGLFFNIGIPLEYEFSEYFWVFVRPSFEYKNYTIALPAGDVAAGGIQFNQPALYVNVGVRMKLPEIRRCPIKSCQTQLKHVHGSREFRGQPFYKEQNPKIGQLYPKLKMHQKKYKGKN